MKYFLIGATADHVAKGVEQGIVQAGHGRYDHVSKMSKGDGIIYYSAKDKMEDGKPLQQFTAIAHITDELPYDVKVSDTFKPFRRNAKYLKSTPADIRPLIDDLTFIKNKKKWGFYLMSGFTEISEADFELIKSRMI